MPQKRGSGGSPTPQRTGPAVVIAENKPSPVLQPFVFGESGTQQWAALLPPIQPNNDYKATAIKFQLRRAEGGVGTTIRAAIWADNADLPGALLGQSPAITFASLPTTLQTVTFPLPSIPLEEDQFYYVGLITPGPGNAVSIGGGGTESDDTAYADGPNGGGWTPHSDAARVWFELVGSIS